MKKYQVQAVAAAKAEAEQQKKIQILAWGVAATMLVVGLAGGMQLYNVLRTHSPMAPKTEKAPAH